MKNAISFLSLAAVAGISILSCSKKDGLPSWVSNSNSNQQSAAKPDPVANFIIYNPFGNVHAPATVGLNNLSLNATSYSWDFGDGTQSTDSFPTHFYSSKGTYTIQLIASNGSKANKTTQIINILSPYTQISISGITIKVTLPERQGARPGPGSIEIFNSAQNKIFSGSDSAKMNWPYRLGHPLDPHTPSGAAEAAADENRGVDYSWTFDSLGIIFTPLQLFWISYDVDLAKYAASGSSYSDSSSYNFQPSALIGGTSSTNSYPPTIAVNHNQTAMTLNLLWQ